MPLVISCVHKNHDIEFAQAMLGGSKHDFSMVCIPVPRKMIGETYMHFFAILCNLSKIPLALYRTSKYDLQEYIYNNPSKDTILQEGDKVYVSHAHSLSNSERLEEVVRVRKVQLEADLNTIIQTEAKTNPLEILASRNKALEEHPKGSHESFREARALNTQKMELVKHQAAAAKCRAEGHTKKADKKDAEANKLKEALETHEEREDKMHSLLRYDAPASSK